MNIKADGFTQMHNRASVKYENKKDNPKHY